MKYRKLGNSGMLASEIGFGSGYFLNKEMTDEKLREIFDSGIAAGMNILDFCLAEHEVRDKTGKAIRGYRDKLIIQGHIGLILEDGQYARTQDLDKAKTHFDDLLARLETDYVDIGMLHCIDTHEDYDAAINSGLVDYMKELKNKGVMKTLGFSSHEPDVSSRMVNSGIFDVAMFSICPLFDLVSDDMEKFFEDMEKSFEGGFEGGFESGFKSGGVLNSTAANVNRTRSAFYALCDEKGVGITVMKVLGAGSLVKAETSPFGVAMTVPQCIHYALNRPAAASVFIGYETIDQVRDSLNYYQASAEELDYSHIFGALNSGRINSSTAKKCLYCNHCLPCASKINIGEVTRLLDTSIIYGKTDELQKEYDSLPAKASSCAQCNRCVKRCPFGINVISNMNRARSLFE